MPFLFILTLIFIFVLLYHIRKNDQAQAQVEAEFWERERQANATRRQDLSNLSYINIPFEKIPQNLSSPAYEHLRQINERKMINLSDLTNTEVKTLYGPANLELLTEYENNYFEYLHALEDYAKELLELQQTDNAKLLAACAKDYGITSIYLENLLLLPVQDLL